jgi:hypothetical protein
MQTRCEDGRKCIRDAMKLAEYAELHLNLNVQSTLSRAR